jgi:hypothetical protein
MKHYHVLSGTKGCLPDYNETYKTLKEALKGAREWRSECSKDHEGWIYWMGSLKDDWYTEPRDRMGTTPRDIGLEYIEITECDEADCLQGEQ